MGYMTQKEVHDLEDPKYLKADFMEKYLLIRAATPGWKDELVDDSLAYAERAWQLLLRVKEGGKL